MELDTMGTNGFDTATGTLYLTFKETTDIIAGRPYLIKWNDYDDLIDPIFPPQPIATATVQNVRAQSTGLQPVEFRTTFTSQFLPAGDRSTLFLTPGNQLQYAEEDRYLQPFRCYFHVADAAAQPIRHFALDFGNGAVTDLHTAPQPATHTHEEYHTIDGRRLQGKPKTGGIYIRNGKKVVF